MQINTSLRRQPEPNAVTRHNLKLLDRVYTIHIFMLLVIGYFFESPFAFV